MLKYLAGPLIGAVIGYFTNYIAVKMLFRPRTEKRFFGVRVPLTPGAIPKGKVRLARAAGEVVSKHLVTEADIGSRFLSAEAENAVVDKVMEVLGREIREDLRFIAEDDAAYHRLIYRIDDTVAREIVAALQRVDLFDLLYPTVRELVMERVDGTVFTMVVNEKMCDQMTISLAIKIKDFLAKEGYDKIFSVVSNQSEAVRGRSVLGLLRSSDIDENGLRGFISSVYRNAVQAGIAAVVRQIDIAGIIESKIIDMPAEELERLALSVMKKELDTIVRLGALIGALIGALNILL